VHELLEALDSNDYSKIRSAKTAVPEKYHIFDVLPVPRTDTAIYDPVTKTFANQQYPLITPSDRAQPRLLAQNLSDALAELDDQFPGYFNSEIVDNYEAANEELSIWMYIFSEAIRQASGHSKAVALLLDAIRDRFATFSKLFVRQLQQNSHHELAPTPSQQLDLASIAQNANSGNVFGGDIHKLNVIIENAPISAEARSEMQAAVGKMESVANKGIEFERHFDDLNKEIEDLKNTNKSLVIANFEVAQERKLAQDLVNDLMEVTDNLRRAIAEGEQRVYTLTHMNAPASMIQGLGIVPPDVLQIWEQMSHFCKGLLEGDLLRVDLDSYFPKKIANNFLPPVFRMQFPTLSNHRVHFTTFFVEMKKLFEEKGLFLRLEGQLREFLEAASKRYEANLREFQGEQTGIANDAVRKLDEYRMTSFDSSIIIKTFVIQRNYLHLPAKRPSQDVHTSMASLYNYASHHPIERSVAQTIMAHFHGPQNPDLIVFIAQIARLAKTEYEVSLLHHFLMGEYPLYVFLFYADIKTKCSELPLHESQAKLRLLSHTFGHCGWDTIPKNKRHIWESLYCQDPVKFCTFCLALYLFCIERIQVQISDIAEADIELSAKSMLNLSDPELFDVSEYMKAIADFGKPTLRDLAILLFKRKMPFERLLSSFEQSQSLVLLGLENFGKKMPRPAKSWQAKTAPVKRPVQSPKARPG
jgi:hypothetical protein